MCMCVWWLWLGGCLVGCFGGLVGGQSGATHSDLVLNGGRMRMKQRCGWKWFNDRHSTRLKLSIRARVCVPIG